MGSLLQETPQSEVNATIEALGSLGVTREHLKAFRKDRSLQDKIATLFKGAVEQVVETIAWIVGVIIPAKPAMLVANCFTGKHIAWRDDDLDKWLAKTVPAKGEGKVSYFQLPRNMQNRELAAEVVGKSGTEEELKKFLKEQGKTYHLAQVDDLLIRTDRGEETGLLTNGWANLFFIEDENGAVFVLGARRHDGGWNVRVGDFAYGGWWFAGFRCFSSNKV